MKPLITYKIHISPFLECFTLLSYTLFVFFSSMQLLLRLYLLLLATLLLSQTSVAKSDNVARIKGFICKVNHPRNGDM